jgi:NAD(P)H-flavin reductase
VFATRGAVCALLLMWCGYSSCLRALVVLLTMCAADWVTRALTVPGDKYTTTRAMPYWPGISQWRQKQHKDFYMAAQFGATVLCLVADTELLPLCTLVAIQGAALLQTLVRKAVISTHTYHMVYTAQLLLPTVLVVATHSVQSAAGLWACASGLSMVRIRFCMDKYLMWMSMGLGTVLWEHGWGSASWLSVFVLCASVWLARNGLAESSATPSADPNTSVTYVDRISDSHARIQLRTRDRLDNIRPGQYVTVSDGDRARKYTPLAVCSGDSCSLVELAVREYPGPTFSHYLCTRAVGDVVVCDGPYGTRFYDVLTMSLCSPEQVVQLHIGDVVVLLAGGSGVVPMYSLACALTRDKVRAMLVVADSTDATAMLVTECQTLPDVHRHVTSNGTRLTHEALSVYMRDARAACACGPPTFLELVSSVQGDVPLIMW